MNETANYVNFQGDWTPNEIAVIEAFLKPCAELSPGNPWTIQKTGDGFKAKRSSWDIYTKGNDLPELLEYLAIYYKALGKTIKTPFHAKPIDTNKSATKIPRSKRAGLKDAKSGDRLCSQCGGRNFYKNERCATCRKKRYNAKNPHKGHVSFSCPHCKSDTLIRKGKQRNGDQRYICKTCKKYCRDNDTSTICNKIEVTI